MTFLFDIGNVLLKLHFERFHEAILGSETADLPESLAALKDPYETGQITDDEFVTRALHVLEHSISRGDFISSWENIFSPNDPMWKVVRKLKEQGHRLILFSNTNALHTRFFLENFPGFEHFDHHHFSHEVGAIKPHPEFYQAALEQFHLSPKDTLYLDDLPENIAAGKQFGFQSWQYDIEQHEACLQWLAHQGITLGSPS